MKSVLLFTLISSLFLLSQESSGQSFDPQEIKKVRLVLEANAGDTFKFKEITARWLQLAGIEIAKFHEDEQATLTIKAETKGVGAEYYDTKTGKSVGKIETGYEIKGTLSFDANSGMRFSKKFKGKVDAKESTVVGNITVPVDEVFYQKGSFVYTLATMIQQLFGFDVMFSASRWNHYHTGELLKILVEESDNAAVEPLLKALKNESPTVRKSAISNLKLLKPPQAVNAIIPLLQDPDKLVKRVAAIALKDLNDPRAVEPLINVMTNGEVNLWAAEALGKLKDPRAIPALIAAIRANSVRQKRHQYDEKGSLPPVFSRAFDALGKIGGPAAVDSLLSCLEGENLDLRKEAASALGQTRDVRAVVPLISALKDRAVRREAVVSLGRIGDKRAVAPLMAILGDQLNGKQIVDALQSLTGQRLGWDRRDLTKWREWWEKNKDKYPPQN